VLVGAHAIGVEIQVLRASIEGEIDAAFASPAEIGPG